MCIDGNIYSVLFMGESMSMPTQASAGFARKATNVTFAEAKALHINISQAAKSGVARAVAEKRAELWLEINRSAIQSSNIYVEQNGLPFASRQRF